MSKRPLGNNGNPKPVRANIRADNQKKNTNQLVEIAAEQFADLLWKTWLHKKNAECKENKRRN